MIDKALMLFYYILKVNILKHFCFYDN